jgi:hypothetical protein
MNKSKPRALRMIRMENPDEEKDGNNQFNIQKVIHNFKVDEYGERLQHVSSWKQMGGQAKEILSIIIIFGWLTLKTRGLFGCAFMGWLWTILILLNTFFDVMTLLSRTLGSSKTISMISDKNMIKIHDINA